MNEMKVWFYMRCDDMKVILDQKAQIKQQRKRKLRKNKKKVVTMKDQIWGSSYLSLSINGITPILGVL